ncbi:MAG: dTDP-4-dehydrorhamnose 3,5-epimerase family protein [Deltaproteobacteria bacterium]|nr:dTDP-4-dehydrorhamnose 3,5-epimerase family protein [Deltaproteobacteria bacterium]
MIPAGIAHTFYNLENIDTINEFNLYLPEPDKIFDPNSLWKLENDIINVPIGSKKLPVVEPNPHQASELVYSRLAAFQEKILPNITAGFPEQFNFTDANNKTHSLLMRKKVDPVSNEAKKIEKLGSIEGVFWQDHLKVATGPDSAVLPLIRKSPFYVVEHGHQSYNHDSYGIHLGQEDRLTFLGRPGKKIHLTLVDCREGSKTLHKKEELVLEVSSFKELVIPQGVAHALRGMEGVYTLNRPFHFMDDRQNYRPGHDVIDWPIDCMNYPVYKINTIPTIDDYYIKSATEQKALMMKKSDYSAPRSQTFIDPKTKTEFRIVLRRRAENQMSEVEEIV